MYSYEERIRAVKLYIKLEGRFGATIRKLGYATKIPSLVVPEDPLQPA